MANFKDGHPSDYLQAKTTACKTERGLGTRTHTLTYDLVSMYFAHYLPIKDTFALSLRIPARLVLPPLLTFEQEFYAGSYLTGFPVARNSGYNLTLLWDTYYYTGRV